MLNESLNSSAVQNAEITDQMAQQLLNHLRDEKLSMTSLLNAVRDVHCALLVLDDNVLEKCLEAESSELSANTALLKQRRQLQGELAAKLSLAPKDVTLRRLAKMTTGSLHDSIDHILQSLAEMAAEVDRLNRQNAAMIGQSLAIARGVVEQLTGSTATHESYNAAGTRAASHVGPLIQWGG